MTSLCHQWGWVSFFGLLLVGCAGLQDEDPANRPTQITYSMAATNKVNPNISGQATPVEFQVFELQDDSMFLSADFDQLIDDPKKALKSTYIEHRDYVLIPGQFKFIEPFEISPQTYYIAVMARYAKADESEWKKVVKLSPKGKSYNLLMYFTGNKVNLVSVE